MDLLGVGPLELVFILLIVFLILGPDDLAATGKKLGRFLSTARKSEFWRGVTQVTKEMRELPTTLMREAELEDAKREIENELRDVRKISREFQQGELREIKVELEKSVPVEENKIAPPMNEEPKQETETEEQEEDADADTTA